MNKHLIGIFVLAVIMLVLPLHIRFAHHNPTLIGTEPYYHARMAMEIRNEIPSVDTAIVDGRSYVINPYHFILSLGYALTGPSAFTLIPVILSLISFVFFWLLLRRLRVPEQTQKWILLVYSLSPPLISTSAIGTPHSLVLVLLMSGAWLLSTAVWPVGILFFAIASFSGPIYAIAAIILLIILALAHKFDNRRIAITLLFSVFALIIGHSSPSVASVQGLSKYLSDLGGIYGFSIFAFLLAIVGAILLWEHKKTYYGVYATVIAFLSASYFYPDLLIFANVLVSALAGIALSRLSERKWELSFLRSAALLVLFCGLLFSGISHAISLADQQPTPSFFKALELPPGTVLTHENYGFWVESAGHTAVIDPLWRELPESEDRAWDVASMFSSTDPDRTKELLKKYNVTYILITPEMQRGLLWDREQQGLDLLVENNKTFKKLETGSNIGVWRVK